MKILVLTDRSPMPAPNGLYVPLETFVRALKEYPNVSIDLCIVPHTNAEDKIDGKEYEGFSQIIKLTRHPRGKLRRLVEEILLLRPAYMTRVKDMHVLGQYDIVFSTPDGFAETLLTYKQEIAPQTLIVLCINEPCYTIHLGQALNLLSTWYRHPFSVAINFARSWFSRQHEQKYLPRMDIVTVQTANEITRIKKLLGDKSHCQPHIYTNPIIKNLLRNEITDSCRTILIHAPRSIHEVQFFIKDVWQPLIKLHADIRLRICIGIITPEWAALNKQQGIEIMGYQENILDVYQDVFAAIVLTRQRYGLVNRVKEAMSAAVTVIGYPETLATLGNVRDGEHVLMATDEEAYLRQLRILVNNLQTARMIGLNARKFVLENENNGPHALIAKLFEATGNSNAFLKSNNAGIPLHHRLLPLSYPFVHAARTAVKFSMPEKHNRLRILLYHDIAPEEQKQFASQLQRLQKHWRFISPELFGAMIRGEEPIQGPNLLLTFDDGFASNKTIADEVLKPMGIQAIFFVVPDFVDIDDVEEARRYIATYIHPNTNPDSLPRHLRNMKWPDLEALLQHGHSIGSHTQSHARLSTLTQPENLEKEIIASADLLEQRLDVKVEHFAFSFGNVGSFNSAALAYAQRRFRFIHSGVRGNNLPNDGSFPILYRDSLSANLSPSAAQAILDGAFDWWYAKDRKVVHQWAHHINLNAA